MIYLTAVDVDDDLEEKTCSALVGSNIFISEILEMIKIIIYSSFENSRDHQILLQLQTLEQLLPTGPPFAT
jgi:hypothetical protein